VSGRVRAWSTLRRWTPIDTGPSGDRLETFDVNERFVVVRDDDGYGVWGLDDLEDGLPVERFPEIDEGFEAAAGRWKELTRQDPRHRNQWLPWLKWIVLISAVAWALSGCSRGRAVLRARFSLRPARFLSRALQMDTRS
jgi:hypothetical protein